MSDRPHRTLEVRVRVRADSWEDVVAALECAANDLKSNQETATGGHIKRYFNSTLERTCEWFNEYDHRPEITHETHKIADVTWLKTRHKGQENE